MKKSRSKKSKKTSKRKGGLRGLRGGNVGERVGLFLTSVLTAGLAHEGVAYLNEQSFMQQAPPKEGQKASDFNFKKIAVSGGLVLAGGAGVALVENKWANAILTGIASGAIVHTKEDAVKPMFGLGSVDDFLNLYRTDKPLQDLGRDESRVDLAGTDPNGVMRKLA